MKSVIEIKDDVWALVKASALANEVTGSVYKNNRPTNSTKEDIVINISASSGTQVQTAILNVNIYVADTKRGNDYVENSTRLRRLSSLALSLLEAYAGNKFNIKLIEQAIMQTDGINEHIINNKIQYKHANN